MQPFSCGGGGGRRRMPRVHAVSAFNDLSACPRGVFRYAILVNGCCIPFQEPPFPARRCQRGREPHSLPSSPVAFRSDRRFHRSCRARASCAARMHHHPQVPPHRNGGPPSFARSPRDVVRSSSGRRNPGRADPRPMRRRIREPVVFSGSDPRGRAESAAFRKGVCRI